MLCKTCNEEITEKNVYCNSCGTKIKASKLDNWKSTVLNDDLGSIAGGVTWDICQDMGFEAYHNREFYEALEYYNKALEYYTQKSKFKNLEVDKKTISALFSDVGIAYQEIGEISNALHFLDLAISSDSNNFSALRNRVGLKIQMEDEIGAIQDMEILIHNSEMKPHTWYYLGVTYENIGDLEKAKLAYERAIAEGFDEALKDLSDVIKKINKR